MNAPAFDAGTLSWVKDEIDLALRQAGEALARLAARPGDDKTTNEARNHLHQAGGALTLVGLAGAARCVEHIEARVAALAEDSAAAGVVAVCAAAGTALATLRRYLDDLAAGQPDQPLRLSPDYRALALAAGDGDPGPLVLFFPDLGASPPPAEESASLAPLAPARLKALRLGFARGLAKWHDGEPRGLTEMRNAIVHLEQNDSAVLWRVARAWFDALDAQDGPAPSDTLLTGLDGQIDRFAGGVAIDVHENLLKGLLYDIAQAPAGSGDYLEAVRAAYRLADLVPEATAATAATVRRDACRAPLTTAIAEWEACAQGVAIALMRFNDVAQLLAASARDSGDGTLATLAGDIADFAAWLRQQPERLDGEIALEVAMALVLVEEAIEQEGARKAADEALFAAAVAARHERLAMLQRNEPLPPPAHQGWRERQQIGQTAREIGAALESVEMLLDGFFRAPDDAAFPQEAMSGLRQVGAVFALLDETQAAQAAAAAVGRMGELQHAAHAGDAELLAESIAALAAYADSLARGLPDPALLAARPASAAPTVVPVAVPPAPTPAAPSTPAAPPEKEHVTVGTLSLPAELFRLYVDEAQDHVAQLRQTLSGPAEVPGRETIRAAHTLAGISASTGFPAVQTLAHALENALVRHSLTRCVPDDDARMLAARAVGALEGMVGAIGERRAPAEEAALAAALDALAVAAAPEPEPQPVPEISPLAERRQTRIADEVDPQLAALFLEEADEQLRQLDIDLRAWRQEPGNEEAGRRIARLLHTFKGGARMCGAMGIGELAHGMETRVEQALAGGGAQSALLDSLDASLGRANQLVDALRPQPQAAAMPAPALPKAEPAPAAPAATPRAAAVPATPAQPPAEPGPAVLLRVRADLIDRLVNTAGEMAIARGRIDGSMKGARGSLLDLTENVARLRSQLREFEILAEASMQSRLGVSEVHQRDFDPLELDRFTRLQELTRMMSESVNDVATVQHTLQRQVEVAGDALVIQSRQNRELSHALLRARMVPFSGVAERLHRIVRQTAKELGRQANLDILGSETPVDRNVLERMLAPLEHLLRNAVAHGIEPPARRADAGKAELGQITLSIVPGDNDIVLSLADDGNGLDYAAIRRRAIERDLLGAEADADETALVDLIFHPGFSTATAISEIAGRGIGLDVVREAVSALGGRIAVGSDAGRGTRFEIVLPLTLALVPVMLVRAAGQTWAIPAAMVEDARELSAADLAARRSAGSIMREGHRYDWHSLPRLYGLTQAPYETGWQLLLHSGGDRIALEAEDLTQNQEVVVKPPGDQLARVPGLTGATVLPDGSVALIVNPVALARRGGDFSSDAAATASAAVLPAPTFAAATVMVVDDSLTVRKITGRLLERAGYRVAAAKDGEDALEQIAAHRPDVVIADIEMPRMDGFELVRRLRADPDLAALPVIMITSRSAEKHRQVARELDVRHYLGKPYDEDELLGLIAALTGR
jgi:chemotaxis protein histidine kinase CheA